jgi:hypothetical protein
LDESELNDVNIVGILHKYHVQRSSFFTVLKTKALEGGNIKKFGLIQSKVPTDSRELTFVESAMAGCHQIYPLIYP